MDSQDEKKKLPKRWLLGIAIYATVFILIIATANIGAINAFLGKVLRILRPVLIGLVIAYLGNPFFRFFERKAFCKLRPQSLRRTLSLICTYLVFVLIVALLLGLILPQLIDSIQDFAANYESYVESAIAQTNKLIIKINGSLERITQTPAVLEPLDKDTFYGRLTDLLQKFNFSDPGKTDILIDGTLDPITDTLGSAASLLTDSFLGLFISLYLLSSKEKRYRQIMKLRNALFNDKVNGRITRFCQLADRSFGSFLEGKLIDSLIIGILAFILFSIFKIPYAVLIATFVGLTNVIPVIGPFIGAIPTAFIILLAEPSKVIPFILLVFFIQQLDGNIIGPKILGNNTGISPLCVIIAIATMTSLWGLLGALLGVPIFATIMALADYYIEDRLQRKGLPADTESYYPADSAVDPVKDMQSSGSRLIKSLEKAVLLAHKKQEAREELTRRDRTSLRLYALAERVHIVSDISDETYHHFSVDEAAKAAEKESNAYMAELNSTNDAE